jgi:hypothetical protein
VCFRVGSVSGALAKKVRRWVRSIPREDLEYFALNMPKESWRELADIIHLHPNDFQCSWFLNVMFGGEPPRDSVLPIAMSATSENLVDVLKGRIQATTNTNISLESLSVQSGLTSSSKKRKQSIEESTANTQKKIKDTEQETEKTITNVSTKSENFDQTQPQQSHISEIRNVIPYSYLRLHVKPIPTEAKVLIATYVPLDTLIWYHEELAQDAPTVNDIITQRLQRGEIVTFGYGKLMERLLYFKRINAPFYHLLVPQAEKRLRSISLELEPPVVVLGDASYSMDVAIRTATIISSGNLFLPPSCFFSLTHSFTHSFSLVFSSLVSSHSFFCLQC